MLRESPESYVKLYKNKLVSRCKAQFERGKLKCEAAFKKQLDSCYDDLPMVLSFVCLPLKIDFICGFENIFANIADVCDPSGIIESVFGDDYKMFKETSNRYVSQYGNVSIDFQTSDPREMKIVKAVDQTTERIGVKLHEKKVFVDYLITVFMKLMILVYLKMIYGNIQFDLLKCHLNYCNRPTDAIRFHDSYLNDIEFNNFYITDDFKTIDQCRIREARKNVLPIKNSEIEKFVDLCSSSNKKLLREFEDCFMLTLRLFLQALSATFFVCLDWIFYELLNIIARHSRINYLQEGVHHLNITVNGAGFIAGLIRASVKGFDVHEHIRVLTTNEPCLPHPHFLESWMIIRIYLLFFFNLYMIYNQVHIHRSKLSICAYFYPKRERKRIVYLHKKILRRRRNAFKMTVARIKERLRVYEEIESRPINIFKVI